MNSVVTVRDWTYVALVAIALATYGMSLISKAIAANTSGQALAHACVLSAPEAKVN
jgi:hypothetical protein